MAEGFINWGRHSQANGKNCWFNALKTKHYTNNSVLAWHSA